MPEFEGYKARFPEIPVPTVDRHTTESKFFDAFNTWLKLRGLGSAITFEDTYEGGWQVYSHNSCKITTRHFDSNIVKVYHGHHGTLHS